MSLQGEKGITKFQGDCPGERFLEQVSINRQEEKGTIEDEVVRWHYQFNGHEFEQTPGDSEGQGSLACCSPWGHRVQND